VRAIARQTLSAFGDKTSVDLVSELFTPLPVTVIAELLGVESAAPGLMQPLDRALDGEVFRLRVIGSIAITASYVAAGRLDGMLSLRPCRSVDIAAAQLIVREAGGALAFGDLALEQAGLGLDERYPIAAAAGELGLSTIRSAAPAQM